MDEKGGLAESADCQGCANGERSRRRWLSDSVAKKGPDIWAWPIFLPHEICPFASTVCRRICNVMGGNFPLHRGRYERNFAFTRSDGFVAEMTKEISEAAQAKGDRTISVCLHLKGEFYSLDYVRRWAVIMAGTRDVVNLRWYIYTRCWRSPLFRQALEDMAAANGNLQVNLSTDSDLVGRHGVPARVGNGLVTYLSEDAHDLPPRGSDLVFYNLRARHPGPMERLGGVVVCPYESHMYVALNGGRPALAKGRCRQIRCQECRLCIDRSFAEWDRIKHRHAGTPGEPPGVIPLPHPDSVQPDAEAETLFGEGAA